MTFEREGNYIKEQFKGWAREPELQQPYGI